MQVHKMADGKVAVFSRNSEDMSNKYPDLVEQLPKVGASDACRRFAHSLSNNLVHQRVNQILRFRCGSRRYRSNHGKAYALPRTESQKAEGRESRRHSSPRLSFRL